MMTDTFDLELGRRLKRLAAAVPVEPLLPLGAVRHAIVRARPTTRGLAPAALVSLLAMVLIGTIVAGLARVGPFTTLAPGASRLVEPTVTDGLHTAAAPTESTPSDNVAQIAVDQDGDFELRLTSDRSSYFGDEPITVTGTLVYRGPEASIEICHAGAGPIGFGVRERIYGAIELHPVYLTPLTSMSGRSTLLRDVGLMQPFQKSGGYPENHRAAESFRAFMLDPILALPSGTWHIYAVAATGPCDASFPAVMLEAELKIVMR